MPNKLPELYLYRLIPGAKQPSRWNIKSRYPVPVVPPAPPSDQNLGNDDLLAIDEPTAVTNPGKPIVTIIGSPILTQVAGDLGLLDVTASIRVTFATNIGGSALKTLNAYMMANNKPVATINRSITPENNTFVDIELKSNNITHGATVDLTASVVNDSGKTSDVSNSVSFIATLREFEFYPSKNY
jgi:hypothetical protein